MDKIKYKYNSFFKSKRPRELADFIATRIEADNTYYIHKARGFYANIIVDEASFKKLSQKKNCSSLKWQINISLSIDKHIT